MAINTKVFVFLHMTLCNLVVISIFLYVCAASCTSALIMNMADSSETWLSIYQARQ